MSEQIQTSSSTPVSTHESSTPIAAFGSQTKATKDKSCPFCHTPYTASSLGRHLDTFIRPKNPKPNDGIHDVDKIREMRLSITRRQMHQKINSKRASSASQTRNVSGGSAKRLSSADGDEDMDDEDGPMSPRTTAPVQRLNGSDPGDSARWTINELSWHDTGVITNIPPRPTSAVPQQRRSVSKQQKLKSNFDTRKNISEELDTARAADLALKEVLGRLKEASARSVQQGIFDFDPYQLNFPALCLKILPAPSTLRSPTPFPTSESWSLSPPGQRQWESLQRAVKEKLVGYQKVYTGVSGSSPLLTPPPFEVDLNKLKYHLNDAYNHWQSLSDGQRQETWQLEILRSFQNAEEGRKDLQNKLDVTIKENEDLRKELEAMRHTLEDDGVDRGRDVSRVATVPPISPKTVQEIWKLGFDVRQWDYESLIEKWKAAMREQKQNTNGMAAQGKLSATPAVTVTSKADRPVSRSMNAAEETPVKAAASKKRSASQPKKKRKSNQSAADIPMGDRPQDRPAEREVEAPAVEFQTPQFHQVQEPSVPVQRQRSPRPPTPQMNAHLSANQKYPNQRRSSAQLSPHSVPSQQRRRSAQYQTSPLAPQHQHQHQQPDPIPQPPSQLLQYSQPPLLQIPQGNADAHQVPIQSSFPSHGLPQPPMQGWMPQQTHQQSHATAHQQPHDPVQTLTPVSVSLPDQTQFNQQPPISDAQFQSMGLQVPANNARRNSHPMINPGQHVGQHVDMQGVEPATSAGGYINTRMPLGMDGLPMGYVGSGMGIVGSAGGRVA